MYCPTCFSKNFTHSKRGTVHMIINSKKMETGRFLYNLEKESHNEVLATLTKKLEEFFRWYGSFQNPEPIANVKLFSSDFSCENGCKRPVGTVFSVVDVIFTRTELFSILQSLAPKYNLQLNQSISTDIDDNGNTPIII